MEQLGEQLQIFGEQLQMLADQITVIGFKILPFSFILFIPFRFIEHIWRKVIYSKLVKGIWYFANGTLTFTGHSSLEMLVAFVLIIESCDHFFDFLDRRRELKEREKRGELYENINIP